MDAFAALAAISEKTFSGFLGVPVAFIVGMVSFFSPCVLPLVPGYLSYVSGVTGAELESGQRRGRLLSASLLFVLGFAVVFTAFGAAASALGGFLIENTSVISRIAGGIVILMGLIFLSGLAVQPLQRLAADGPGVVRNVSNGALKVVGVFMKERGIHVRSRAGLVGAPLVGGAFAVGWIPCVGPGLGAILGLAYSEAKVARGAFLLFVFSLGFGVWFVLGGLAFHKAARAFQLVRRHMRGLTAVGGVFLLTIGILLVTDQWNELLAPLRRLINVWAPPI